MFSLVEERFMKRYRTEEMVGWMMKGVNHNDRKGHKRMQGYKKVLKGADEWQRQ